MTTSAIQPIILLPHVSRMKLCFTSAAASLYRFSSPLSCRVDIFFTVMIIKMKVFLSRLAFFLFPLAHRRYDIHKQSFKIYSKWYLQVVHHFFKRPVDDDKIITFKLGSLFRKFPSSKRNFQVKLKFVWPRLLLRTMRKLSEQCC